MLEERTATPKEKADQLIREFDEDALLKASLIAHQAIEAHDISGCLYWQQVIKVLRQSTPDYSAFN